MLINVLLLSSLINEPVNFGFLRLKNNNFDINHIILTSKNIEIEKIGIVDFRFILKKSNAMKILGDKFISLENEMNNKIKSKQEYLKNKELKITKQKKDLSTLEYKNKIDLFKSEVFKIQKQFKEERLILNNSFKSIQNDLKDMLAKVIKNVSIEKKNKCCASKRKCFLI